MLKTLLLLFVFAFPLTCQSVVVTPPGTARVLHITISKQSGMARALTGLNFDGYSATACSVDGQAMQIGGGALWQAAEGGGLQPVTPHVSAVAATQKRAKSKWELISVGGTELMWDLAFIAAGNAIKVDPASVAGKAVRIAPIYLARKLQIAAAEREKVQPDAVAMFADDYLKPAELLQIPAGSGVCVQRVFLATAGGAANVVTDVTIHQ